MRNINWCNIIATFPKPSPKCSDGVFPFGVFPFGVVCLLCDLSAKFVDCLVLKNKKSNLQGNLQDIKKVVYKQINITIKYNNIQYKFKIAIYL